MKRMSICLEFLSFLCVTVDLYGVERLRHQQQRIANLLALAREKSKALDLLRNKSVSSDRPAGFVESESSWHLKIFAYTLAAAPITAILWRCLPRGFGYGIIAAVPVLVIGGRFFIGISLLAFVLFGEVIKWITITVIVGLGNLAALVTGFFDHALTKWKLKGILVLVGSFLFFASKVIQFLEP
ncbi:MAG TPA: hypothetical protein VEZ90_15345 [Blastocatellia bacterium]|nr:hypothetical protein [Blastocatellia bacterium]